MLEIIVYSNGQAVSVITLDANGFDHCTPHLAELRNFLDSIRDAGGTSAGVDSPKFIWPTEDGYNDLLYNLEAHGYTHKITSYTGPLNKKTGG